MSPMNFMETSVEAKPHLDGMAVTISAEGATVSFTFDNEAGWTNLGNIFLSLPEIIEAMSMGGEPGTVVGHGGPSVMVMQSYTSTSDGDM